MAVKVRDVRNQFWVQSTNPVLEGRLGTVFALANGYLGLRGHHEEMPAWGRPEFYVSGTYAPGPASLLGFHDADHILTHPDRITPEFLASVKSDAVWTLPNFPNPLAVRLTVGDETFSWDKTKVLSCERLMEMDNATLRRCLVFRDQADRRTRVESRRFVSFADRNLIALQYRVKRLDHSQAVSITPYINSSVTNTNGVVLWDEVAAADSLKTQGHVNAIQCRTHRSDILVSIVQTSKIIAGDDVTLELFVIAGEMPVDDALRRAHEAMAEGFDALLASHVQAYRSQALRSMVEFDDNVATVQGFEFGQMHMHMAMPTDSRVGVPIKGLTGHGYRFANFWDMDFHMFQYYLLTQPHQARRLLEYRFGQLDAYRANARRWGAAGAQVPWETQVAGDEVTAPWLCLQDREIHISADAAYMFKLYDDLTPDSAAMADMGAEFTFETARFYASRIKFVPERGRYELPGIGCPDQYHTQADNSFFINKMALWNLRQAISLAQDKRFAAAARKVDLAHDEVARWADIAGNFFIQQPNEQGIIEEFDGFFSLCEDIEGICETYCRHSQAVKQCDVLAAFWPWGEEYSREVQQANWHYYADRTLHGSSLSLPGMALSAARCGLNDEALYYLHKSCRMDLDDVNLDTERGVHVTGGAVQWYAIVQGFGGLTPRRDGLHIAPNLPRQWRRLAFTACWQFQRLSVELTPGIVTLSGDTKNDKPVVVILGDARLEILPGQKCTHQTQKE